MNDWNDGREETDEESIDRCAYYNNEKSTQNCWH